MSYKPPAHKGEEDMPECFIDLTSADVLSMAQFVNASPEPGPNNSPELKAIYWKIRAMFDHLPADPDVMVYFLVRVRGE